MDVDFQLLTKKIRAFGTDFLHNLHNLSGY